MAQPNDHVDKTPRELIRDNFLLKIKEVCKVLGVSRTELKKLRAKEDFPKPVKQTCHICFRTDDIVAWIQSK